MLKAEIDCVFEDARWADALSAPDASEAARRAFAEAGVTGEAAICIAFTDDAAVQALNRDYRGKDKPTNVLSFPMDSGTLPGAERHMGDIALAYETVAREAQESGIPLRDHALHLIVHGSLHLIGYTHEKASEAERMESLEIRVLSRLGIENPYELPNRNERE